MFPVDTLKQGAKQTNSLKGFTANTAETDFQLKLQDHSVCFTWSPNFIKASGLATDITNKAEIQILITH